MAYVLDELHNYFHCKIILVWDNPQGHKGLEAKYNREHPDWFHFERLPTYSPELNVAGQCWNHVKNHGMANFAAKKQKQIVTQVQLATKAINKNKKTLPDFLKHSKLKR
jgi:transposase